MVKWLDGFIVILFGKNEFFEFCQKALDKIFSGGYNEISTLT